MKLKVNNYMSSCGVCHRSKDDNVAYPRLSQPFPVPNQT